MAEKPFEYLTAAIESTRGTAIAAPTHYLNLDGMINPRLARYRPDESTGLLAEWKRSKVTRKWSEWEGEGPLDLNNVLVLLNAAVKPVTSPSTPASGILTRLWTFTPTMTSDDIKTLTMFWGDPNIQIFQAPFCTVEEFTVSSNAGAEDEGATLSVSGMGNFPTKLAAPALPAQNYGPLVIGQNIQLWIDTTTIGTTAVTGRVVSAEHKIKNNITYKYLAAGPASTLGYTRIGRKKRHLESKVVFELLDMTQYDQWVAATTLKVRIRHNGDLIETVAGPIDYYNYFQVDVYGPQESMEWGLNEDSNRTIELTMFSEYDGTLGADFSFAVQNQKTAL